jgi:hypothetical protein
MLSTANISLLSFQGQNPNAFFIFAAHNNIELVLELFMARKITLQ